MSTVRLLLWSLADSRTTLAEVREVLPELPAGDAWISNAATDRLGLVSLSGKLPELDGLHALIGKDPEIGEEFDLEA